MKKHYFTKSDSDGLINQLGDIDFEVLAADLDSWKVGQKGHICLVKESRLKSSEQLGYYYGLILPLAFEQFSKSGNDILQLELKVKGKGKIVKLPLTKDNLDHFFKVQYAEKYGEYKDKADMNMAECAAFEDYVIKWLFVWFDCVITEAKPVSRPD